MDNDLETLLNSTLEEFPEKDVENQEFLKQFSQNIQIQESVKGTIDSIRSEKDQPQEENIDSLLDNLSSLMDNGELDSLLTNVMDQIVSKDLLYEPMKDLASKYPEFLLKSKNTVQQEEYSRFEEQFRIVNEIISVYDNENDAVKVLKLMQDVILNLLN
jgi:peroxin-19